jgi:hypothetical protein
MSGQRVRLAELLAAVSLATDLADDAPADSALGDAVTVVDIARMIGLSGQDASDACCLALLYHASYQAVAAGRADVTARRTTCGEAMSCGGNVGLSRVTAVVAP